MKLQTQWITTNSNDIVIQTFDGNSTHMGAAIHSHDKYTTKNVEENAKQLARQFHIPFVPANAEVMTYMKRGSGFQATKIHPNGRQESCFLGTESMAKKVAKSAEGTFYVPPKDLDDCCTIL
ncbi:MAG TPA: hypothetical protein VLE95_04655 [Chlamydiales bacterium]|nr:hypothetical protein [Chlamydiales bacterium]